MLRRLASRLWREALCAVACSTPLLFSAGPSYAADFSSLTGKHIVGYQGWFGCPSDPVDPRWFHWFRGGSAGPETLSVDLWPDVSEFEKSELCPTGLTLPSGAPAFVFSSENAATVRRHFRWMRQYEIDGAAVQRFVSEIGRSPSVDRADLVLKHVRTAAEAEARGFFVMYDVSGVDGDQAIKIIQNDWRRLAAERLTASPSYMRHNGRPVVGVWGLGFKTRAVVPAQAAEIIRFFKEEAKATLLGGVPAHWRTLDGDSRTGQDWAGIYASFDILSPWTVARFRNPTEADAFARNVIAADLEETRARGQEYMPVIFPGFSWHNLQHRPLDQIPRLCGALYEEQAANVVRLGADMLYTAMFDELDEGTALMEVVRASAELPANVELLAPDKVGCTEGSDLYLRLGREASARLHQVKNR